MKELLVVSLLACVACGGAGESVYFSAVPVAGEAGEAPEASAQGGEAPERGGSGGAPSALVGGVSGVGGIVAPPLGGSAQGGAVSAGAGGVAGGGSGGRNAGGEGGSSVGGMVQGGDAGEASAGGSAGAGGTGAVAPTIPEALKPLKYACELPDTSGLGWGCGPDTMVVCSTNAGDYEELTNGKCRVAQTTTYPYPQSWLCCEE